MEIISTNNAPAAVGPYSQAMIADNLIFVSGQLGIDKDGKFADGIAAQTENAINNVSAILSAAGSSIDKVVKTTCFLSNIADFAAFNEIYAKYFISKPARSLIQAAALPKGSLIELEAIALK